MIKNHMAVGITDLGKSRANNEDYFLVCETLNLYVLADGIGGHQYGEVAAKLACETVVEKFRQINALSPITDLDTAQAALKFAIYSANRAVYQKALDEPVYKTMGTTLVVCFIFQSHAFIAHVGDSRCYILDSKLEPKTLDHIIFAPISPKSRSLRPKHYLTKTIGIKEFVEPTISIVPLAPGQELLICSDGLSDYLPHLELEALMKEKKNLDQKANNILSAILKYDAKDNITFILIKPELEESLQNC